MTSVTINKPSTLVAGNIKSGVTIAGVTGTYGGSVNNPYTAANATEMAQYLASKYDGAVVRYTGTSGTYTQNMLYKVKAVSSNEWTFEELITPAGSTTVTENGTYDVKEYARVVVNVPSSGGSSTFPIYIRNAGGTLLHTLNISEED